MEGSVSSWRASARLMLRFGAAAVPVIGVDVAKLLIPALTTMHVGREFGAEALAAASLGTLSLNIAGNMIAMSPMNALDSVAPQAHGSGDYAAVGLAAQRAYILSLIFLLPSAPLWIRAETLLGILGQPSRICALAAAFMRLALPGLPAFAGFECARKWLYAQGMVWPPLAAVALGLTAHLAWLPLSGAMAGFKGAPLAVVATNWICFAALLLIIRYKTPEAAKAWPRGADARQRLWEPRAWRRFVGISVAALCAQSEWLFWEVVCFRVGAFGTLPLAVYSVSYALEPVFFMIPMGMSTALANGVGNLLGANRVGPARTLAVAATGGGLAIIAIYVSGALALGPHLARLFGHDADVLRGAAASWPSFCLFMLFAGPFALAMGLNRGLGLQRVNALCVLFILWPVGVPLVVFGARSPTDVWHVLTLVYSLLGLAMAACACCASWPKLAAAAAAAGTGTQGEGVEACATAAQCAKGALTTSSSTEGALEKAVASVARGIAPPEEP